MAELLADEASHLTSAAGWSSFLTCGKLEEPEYSSTNWYFTRDEIERNSPSRKDGVDVGKETYFRKSYCTFLQDLGMRLKVPQVTIATAIVLCHRFFLRQSHARNDRFMVGTVCMFVAGKVEETPRPLRDVIIISYELRNKKDPVATQRIRQKDVFEDQKELLLLGEHLVLTTLEFDMNIHHPYKPLVTAIKRFKVAQVALAQVAWNFVNDGLRTSLCLQFKPHHIAAGAIFLATKFLRVKLPVDGEKVWWHEFDVTPRQLEDVSNQMLELYEQNKAGPRASDLSVSAGVCNGFKSDIPSHGHLQTSLPANGVSQLSPIGSFSGMHDEVSADNADAAPSNSQREPDFGYHELSKGYVQGRPEGPRRGVYPSITEDRANTEMIENYQEPVYDNDKIEANVANGFHKQSTYARELTAAIGIHDKENSYDTHGFPAAATKQKPKYVRPESQGYLLLQKDEIYGHKILSEENHTWEDSSLKGGVQKPAEINKTIKEGDGKQRPSLNFQGADNDTFKMSSEKKRKAKAVGGEDYFGVKEEIPLKTGHLLREPENAVEVAAEPDVPENRRSHVSRDNTSSLEIAYDAEVESWSSAKRTKLTNTDQAYHNAKGKGSYEKGNLHRTNIQMVKSYERMEDRVEDVEFGLQKHNKFSKASNTDRIIPGTFGKTSNMSEQVASQQSSAIEGPSEKKHWHGKNLTSLSSSHRQQVQNSFQHTTRHHYKDQVWQEQDSK